MSHIRVLRHYIHTPFLDDLGWHYFVPELLPPRLENRGVLFYALTTSSSQVIMVAAVLPDGCSELASFFTESITRKYELATEDITTDVVGLSAFAEVQRWSSRGRHIVLACSAVSYLLYGDAERLSDWEEILRDRSRIQVEAKRLRLIAETTRLLPGDRHHVHGAFGLMFANPVEGHERMIKEKTVPWSGVVLPVPYHQATFEVVLDPDGHPTRIAGTFAGVDYDAFKSALEARFGGPGSSTPTHVIHKVGGDFVSLRKHPSGVRLVVIDHETDTALRSRAKQRAKEKWEAETEGL